MKNNDLTYIRFVLDAEVKQGDGNGPRYGAGSVHAVPATSADHWISRGKAQKITEAEYREGTRRPANFIAETAVAPETENTGQTSNAPDESGKNVGGNSTRPAAKVKKNT